MDHIKFYYLGTCSTCIRIMNELSLPSSAVLQDIKQAKITADQLNEMVALSGSYEALFSKRARKYKELGLKDKNLGEQDLRNYILEEYTFLKRPVMIAGDQIFIGNAAKTVEAMKKAIS